MNIARTAIGSATLDGMLYTVGGECALIDTQENTLYLRCMECYDPVQRQWIPKPEMKIARSFVAVAALNGVLYAIGRLFIKSFKFFEKYLGFIERYQC